MTREEAAGLIDQMAKSLEDSPGQFHVSVSVTGTQVNVSSGGGGGNVTGLKVEVQGGGAGSKTTGFQSTASTGDVQITRGKADAALRTQVGEAVGALRQVAAELRAPAPDRKKIGDWIGGLPDWLPNIVTTAAQFAISRAIGTP